jgi:hypothetical protein
MLNTSDLWLSLVIGLAVPLAMLDCARTILDIRLPEQSRGFQFERRASPWILSILLGPALFFEQCFEMWRGGISKGDAVAATTIMIGWACLYGFVVLKLLQALHL